MKQFLFRFIGVFLTVFAMSYCICHIADNKLYIIGLVLCWIIGFSLVCIKGENK